MMSSKVSVVSSQKKTLKHKRRYCKIPGCEKIVKSQGLCQRHGAKPRKCKVDGCTKQAQGNFEGMCKSHFKSAKTEDSFAPTLQRKDPRNPSVTHGESVFDKIIPESIAWNPSLGTPMPLVAHLKAGFDAGKPAAWHRNEERMARGERPVTSPSTQLETWERELVWTEILILTGNSQTSFRHLARAWGRDKGFQSVLAQFICERKGNVARKMRDVQSPAPIEPLYCIEIPLSQDESSQGGDDSSVSGSTDSASEDNVDHDNWEDIFYNDIDKSIAVGGDLLGMDQGIPIPEPTPLNQVQQQPSFSLDSIMMAELLHDPETPAMKTGVNHAYQNQHPI